MLSCMSEMPASPPHLAAPDVRVSVSVSHLSVHSRPGRQVFSYVIRIENHTTDSWQVLGQIGRAHV